MKIRRLKPVEHANVVMDGILVYARK